MKHLYLGLGILSVILLLSLLSLFLLGRSLGRAGDKLEAAWTDCLERDFEKARAGAVEAQKIWEKSYGLTASFVDHGDLDEVNRVFAQMEACGALEEWDEFAQTCRQVMTLIEDIAQRQKPLYYNFL